MKRIIYVLLITIFCSRLFSGCEQKTVEEPLTVYSFSGENEMFSILNGVAVLNSEQEIFYGGDFRACLKNHSRDLHSPLSGESIPNLINIARYAS